MSDESDDDITDETPTDTEVDEATGRIWLMDTADYGWRTKDPPDQQSRPGAIRALLEYWDCGHADGRAPRSERRA